MENSTALSRYSSRGLFLCGQVPPTGHPASGGGRAKPGPGRGAPFLQDPAPTPSLDPHPSGSGGGGTPRGNCGASSGGRRAKRKAARREHDHQTFDYASVRRTASLRGDYGQASGRCKPSGDHAHHSNMTNSPRWQVKMSSEPGPWVLVLGGASSHVKPRHGHNSGSGGGFGALGEGGAPPG